MQLALGPRVVLSCVDSHVCCTKQPVQEEKVVLGRKKHCFETLDQAFVVCFFSFENRRRCSSRIRMNTTTFHWLPEAKVIVLLRGLER